MLSEKNRLITILSIFFLISVTGSIFQAKYTYDSFHWGLVSQSALDLLDNKTPYKDIFIHYGFVSTLTQYNTINLQKKYYLFDLFFSDLLFAGKFYFMSCCI